MEIKEPANDNINDKTLLRQREIKVDVTWREARSRINFNICFISSRFA